MRIIVAGGRDFTDRSLLFRTLDSEFGRLVNYISVISGRAKGADQFGEEWAESKGLSVENGGLELYPADWDTYGKSAGFRRNCQMGDVSTHLISFWDGKSRGSADMLSYALQKGLWVKVVIYGSDTANPFRKLTR